MKSDKLKYYRERWMEIEQIERREQAESTIETRWQQVNTLRNMAIALGLSFEEDEEEKLAIYQRWAKLKKAQ
jgi:hypothetical protein